jgi:hypothetical protein
MSTPFLHAFATDLMDRLLEAGLVELDEAGAAPAVEAIATHLGQVRHGSLLSSIAEALHSTPGVVDFWADDDDLKAIVEAMGPGRR